jgi:hypothetical protein
VPALLEALSEALALTLSTPPLSRARLPSQGEGWLRFGSSGRRNDREARRAPALVVIPPAMSNSQRFSAKSGFLGREQYRCGGITRSSERDE